jgi:hypothetical protein
MMFVSILVIEGLTANRHNQCAHQLPSTPHEARSAAFTAEPPILVNRSASTSHRRRHVLAQPNVRPDVPIRVTRGHPQRLLMSPLA